MLVGPFVGEFLMTFPYIPSLLVVSPRGEERLKFDDVVPVVFLVDFRPGDVRQKNETPHENTDTTITNVRRPRSSHR